jgi:tripartite-type tricarboxylate transporter receptor subunit TctC
MKRIFNLIIALFLVSCMANFSFAAVDFPTKPITLIVPVPPGGSGDLYARVFASAAERLIGQSVVVANKAGASGQVGLFALSQAAPDGYTLSTFSILEFCAIEWEIVNNRKSTVTADDFIVLGSFTMSPYVITVPYSSPWKTLSDMINDAKVKPGYYSFSSGGMYSAHHTGAEFVMESAGVKFRHTPFAGGAPAVTALVGNHVDWGVTSPGGTINLMQGNKLRILAVLSDKRYKPIPDIPTAKELGVDVEWYTYVGILASRKTPTPILEKLKKIVEKTAQDKWFIDTMEKRGELVTFTEGENITKIIGSDLEKVRRLYKRLLKEQK